MYECSSKQQIISYFTVHWQGLYYYLLFLSLGCIGYHLEQLWSYFHVGKGGLDGMIAARFGVQFHFVSFGLW